MTSSHTTLIAEDSKKKIALTIGVRCIIDRAVREREAEILDFGALLGSDGGELIHGFEQGRDRRLFPRERSIPDPHIIDQPAEMILRAAAPADAPRALRRQRVRERIEKNLGRVSNGEPFSRRPTIPLTASL
jgi:hypothetical protein